VKIQSSTTRPAIPADGSSPRSAVSQAYASGTASSSSAQVELSPVSRKLVELQNGKSDVSAERVAAIRAAIASGQIKIDPEKIADGLIASARDLLK
jgi:negative regulator of flagellin synthesis FlgM